MTSSRHWLSAAALSACVVLFSQPALAAPAATVDVDAREIGRGLQHVHMALPVKPGMDPPAPSAACRASSSPAAGKPSPGAAMTSICTPSI
jgi:hypothetical protein